MEVRIVSKVYDVQSSLGHAWLVCFTVGSQPPSFLFFISLMSLLANIALGRGLVGGI